MAYKGVPVRRDSTTKDNEVTVSYKNTMTACQKILELQGLEGEALGAFRDEIGYALLNLAKAIEADLSRLTAEVAQLRESGQRH